MTFVVIIIHATTSVTLFFSFALTLGLGHDTATSSCPAIKHKHLKAQCLVKHTEKQSPTNSLKKSDSWWQHECLCVFMLLFFFISARESRQSLFIASVAFFTQTQNKQLRAKTEGADHFQYLFPKDETHLLPDWKAPIRLLLLFIVSVSGARAGKSSLAGRKKKKSKINNLK